VALNWLHTSGVHEIMTAQFLHQTSVLADAQNGAELVFRSLLLLANGMLMTREGDSLIGGLFGITGTETNRFQKFLQRWGQLALGVGGIAWAVDGGFPTAVAIHSMMESGLHGDWLGNGTTAVVDMATTLARTAFTWAAMQSFADEFRRTHALPMRDTSALSKPQLILAGALGAAMIISLAQIGGPVVVHHLPWDGTHVPPQSPGTPAPSLSGTPAPSHSPGTPAPSHSTFSRYSPPGSIHG
jgi:hypothetical protein